MPTRAMLGARFPLEQFVDAFAVMKRKVPGRDAVRFSLELS